LLYTIFSSDPRYDCGVPCSSDWQGSVTQQANVKVEIVRYYLDVGAAASYKCSLPEEHCTPQKNPHIIDASVITSGD